MLATVCPSGCTYVSLEAALADLDADPIELRGGDHPGPFHVERDLTLRGTDGAALVAGANGETAPVLSIGGAASVVVEDLVVSGGYVVPGVDVGTGGSLTLRRVELADGFATGEGACLLAEGAVSVVLEDTAVRGCLGERSSMRIDADAVALERVSIDSCSSPALVVEGAGDVVLHDLVAQWNGWLWRVGPAVDLVGVGSLDVLRSWFCVNLGDGAGALRVDGGCTGDCAVAHSVFQLNGGGGLVWSGADGRVHHSTFAANTSFQPGTEVRVEGGSVALDHLLVLDGVAPEDVPAFSRAAAASAAVTDTTIHAVEPGIPIGVDGNEEREPAFVAGQVPPACGLSVTLDPLSTANEGLVVWPEDSGRGALTTKECGPWCADADQDGSPAMWDCAEDDPTRGHHVPEVVDDGLDQDCDGLDSCWSDADGDGWGGTPVPKIPLVDCGPPVYAADGGDCDDEDWTISPDGDERPGDATDGDCDGLEDCFADADGDGFSGPALATVPDLACAGDGVAPDDEGDCDDADPTVFPGAPDAPNDGVDADCALGDPRDLLSGGACGCGSGGSGGLAGLLGLLATRRPRSGR